MVDELLKDARTPEGPLQILQAGLEAGIQVVVHTLEAYETHYLLLQLGKRIPLSDLGYGAHLCNMALVNAAASWDGFKGNIVRAVKDSGHSLNRPQLQGHLKQISSYKHIVEPLARRHCIVHNLAKVDQDYKRDVPSSSLDEGDSLEVNLPYLKDASLAFFEAAVELVQFLVGAKLLPKGQEKTIGKFQRGPDIQKQGV